MKVGIGICAYNAEIEMLRVLDSTEGIYPTFVIDKAWKGFGKGYSTDNTAFICNDYSNVVLIQPKGELTEAQCRNEYMKASAHWNLDAMIILDTDEYLEFPLGIEYFYRQLSRMISAHPEQLAFRATYIDTINGTSFSPRIILNPSITRYRDKHNQLFCMDKEVITNDKSIYLCGGIIITEDKCFRLPEREKWMKDRNQRDPTH